MKLLTATAGPSQNGRDPGEINRLVAERDRLLAENKVARRRIEKRGGNKVILFWLRKRARNPKMQGLATAVGSADHINTMARMASEGKGKLFIVEARTAEAGRALIKKHLAGESAVAMKTVLEGGAIVALGTRACLAIAGAASSIRQWKAQGYQTDEQSRALKGDGFDSWNPNNAFGRGLGGDK